MPAKVNTPTTTPTPQAPSQNLLRGNVVPPARSKIRDLMEKFEREQFKNDVDDLENRHQCKEYCYLKKKNSSQEAQQDDYKLWRKAWPQD